MSEDVQAHFPKPCRCGAVIGAQGLSHLQVVSWDVEALQDAEAVGAELGVGVLHPPDEVHGMVASVHDEVCAGSERLRPLGL